MPEGHTIHRIARDHAKLLAGRVVSVSSPQGRFSGDAALVDGQVLDRIEAYGKHLFLWWTNGHVGHVHLGLFGKFRVQRRTVGDELPEPIGEVRMRMTTDESVVDLAGPTACAIVTEPERDAIVDRLGPDPLRRDARPAVAIERIHRSRQALGALLLDQSVLCGVGNVYRAEALFVNALHPSRHGRDTSLDELTSLWTTVVTMLRQGVKDDRIITVDRRGLDLSVGRRLRRGEATYVYHRDLCLRCETPIRTVELAGRPCYYCPTCQPG
jgi:endonuclease-8